MNYCYPTCGGNTNNTGWFFIVLIVFFFSFSIVFAEDSYSGVMDLEIMVGIIK